MSLLELSARSLKEVSCHLKFLGHLLCFAFRHLKRTSDLLQQRSVSNKHLGACVLNLIDFLPWQHTKCPETSRSLGYKGIFPLHLETDGFCLSYNLNAQAVGAHSHFYTSEIEKKKAHQTNRFFGGKDELN